MLVKKHVRQRGKRMGCIICEKASADLRYLFVKNRRTDFLCFVQTMKLQVVLWPPSRVS